MISHHHKCVFVHIPKNAGQSIENVFLNLLNLTWKNRAPLLLRFNENPELGPERLAHLKSYEYTKFKYMTDEQYETYFSFAFVRNPWDRVVSYYKYLGYANKCDFNSFVSNELKRDLWNNRHWFVGPQSDYLYLDGVLNVDFVGRFENLQEDFNKVCSELGLEAMEVPHINKSHNNASTKLTKTSRVISSICNFLNEPSLIKIKQKAMLLIQQKKQFPTYKNYWEYYNEESKKIVSELYKNDIENFNYTFEKTRKGN